MTSYRYRITWLVLWVAAVGGAARAAEPQPTRPRGLLPRYLCTNPRFMYGVARQYLRERTRHS